MRKEIRKVSEDSTWKWVSAILGILLVASIATRGFDFRDDAVKVQDGLGKIIPKVESESDRTVLNRALTTLNSIKGPAASGTTGQGQDTTGQGNREGKVVIEEFSDFQCPFCARAYETVNQIKQEYGDDVELVYKHYPLSFHPEAQKAAEASECARDQGKFWEYHDILFENQASLGMENYKRWASDLGLDSARFDSCLDQGTKQATVQEDFAEGQGRGVSGTPTFFIGGQRIVGAQPYTVIKQAIDTALSGDAPAPAPSQPQANPGAQQLTASAGVDDDPSIGEMDAPITIVEFSDFQCPFCARFYEQSLQRIMEEYINTGKARLVYRDYPLSFHPEAKPSAIAAECADEQGKFWEYHDILFKNQDSLGRESYISWAEETGLDVGSFTSCLDDADIASEVDSDFAEGQASGITGTPTFIIGVMGEDGTVEGTKVVGAQPFDAFKAVLDQELEQQ